MRASLTRIGFVMCLMGYPLWIIGLILSIVILLKIIKETERLGMKTSEWLSNIQLH